jgi:hypothetical protein
VTHLRLLDGRDPATRLADRWFRDGRLVAIPARRGKRLPVLDQLAQQFEPGVTYTEGQVNDTLRVFHPDVAALRRYLVDEGFMARTPAGSEYWRAGGHVHIS